MKPAAWRRLKYGNAPVLVCCPRCGLDTLDLKTGVCSSCKPLRSISLDDIAAEYHRALHAD